MDGYLICFLLHIFIITLLSFLLFSYTGRGHVRLYHHLPVINILCIVLDKTDTSERTQKTEVQARLEAFGVVSNNFFFPGNLWERILFFCSTALT